MHLFTSAGIDPARLAVIGLGEHRPAQSNDTPEGRNANRRVLLVIMSGNGMPEGNYAEQRGKPEEEEAPPTAPATITDASPPPQSAPMAEMAPPAVN